MRDQQLFEKALQITPWATQTNAKRPKPILSDTMPTFAQRARGCRMINAEGTEYIDFFCACGPIILGYADDVVDAAAIEQIRKGIVYSVASVKEVELAERLLRLIPSLEWVKFLKTGGDATTAAVRIVRAYTEKQKILQCGFHGWHDWFQAACGAGRAQGVPDATRDYTIPFRLQDLDFVERTLASDDDIAGIILTPYDWEYEPVHGELQRLRALCDRYRVPLIFDEVLTGFRIGMGGAQEVFGVTPDLSVFAKAISNGYPLAVVGGKKAYGDMLNANKTIITTTYAGDAVSLAAALATLSELTARKAHEHIYQTGAFLKERLDVLIQKNGYPLHFLGRAPLLKLCAHTGDGKKDMDLQLRISRGFMAEHLFIKEHGGVCFYMNAAHGEAEVEQVVQVAEKVFSEAMDG